ncbi:hypothetical protein SVAN01_06358 [Stagonosporopsis vannaccii]|nr:hypothetical protein SVAN01_06358 [Stagonosporopsis vannaccii]
MSSREAMHGESTQARQGGRASKQRRRREGAARHGAAGVWSSVGTRGVTESEQRARDSEDRQTRHSAQAHTRNSASWCQCQCQCKSRGEGTALQPLAQPSERDVGRACIPPADKGGRERTQSCQFWMPHPAATRSRGTSCYLTAAVSPRPRRRARSSLRGLLPCCPAALTPFRPPVLLESPSTAPCTPSLADLSIAPGLARQARQLHRHSWQASGQQIALRLENDRGGRRCRTKHPGLARPPGPGLRCACLFHRASTSTVFGAAASPCLLPAACFATAPPIQGSLNLDALEGRGACRQGIAGTTRHEASTASVASPARAVSRSGGFVPLASIGG